MKLSPTKLSFCFHVQPQRSHHQRQCHQMGLGLSCHQDGAPRLRLHLWHPGVPPQVIPPDRTRVRTRGRTTARSLRRHRCRKTCPYTGRSTSGSLSGRGSCHPPSFGPALSPSRLMFIRDSEPVHRAELVEARLPSGNDAPTAKAITVTELCRKRPILGSAATSKGRKSGRFR